MQQISLTENLAQIIFSNDSVIICEESKKNKIDKWNENLNPPFK